MQSLRRIPACAQVRVLFLNRSYAASTSSTDALVRLNAISRMNSRSVLRFDDRNLIKVAFLSFQRRGFQPAVQNSGGKKQETSEDEIKKIYYNYVQTDFVLLGLQLIVSMALAYWNWSNETIVKNKVGKQYASYLSSESIPFDDSIEELLKSGKVTQIIHLVHFQKAVAVLNPGLVVKILSVFSSILAPFSHAGEEAVVLNLENSAWKVQSSAAGFTQEVRRIEKQIGIEPSNEVPIKVEGEQQIWFTWVQFLWICTVFFLLRFIRNLSKARNIVRGKLKTV